VHVREAAAFRGCTAQSLSAFFDRVPEARQAWEFVFFYVRARNSTYNSRLCPLRRFHGAPVRYLGSHIVVMKSAKDLVCDQHNQRGGPNDAQRAK